MGIMSEMALEQWERDVDEQQASLSEPEQEEVLTPIQEAAPPADDSGDILAALRMMVSENSEPAASETSQSVAESAPAEKSEPEQTAAVDEEARKKAAHEAAEDKREAEFKAKHAEKAAKLQAEMDKVAAMPDSEVTGAGAERLHALTERLTRRDMKTMVMETLTEKCKTDAAFARLCMNPKKDMIKCFKYINRHARKYIEDLLKDRGEKAEGMYGEDVPDDLCYQWAEEYFRDVNAEEDKEQEEKFTRKPYTSSSPKSKSKRTEKRSEPKKKPKPEPQKEADNQISLGDLMAA